ncbi:amidohydrolase family protein [Halalkalicoccus jeotgali]|uniref:Amidohydrolase n=1 Tax=Halalkalicoccus jeotgali (strain DSM 18796 / CECT 7217 / JCM 14584 / KCTC 4019 / B3) TaxID=795797 RepID=D8JAR1_HALJB|nr:amidohydrolase family protein [Halalkalicoccus jeotgali]ADJ14783.1 amidohydrolase [Halalkalicoccus jeotgali B3]ELY39365.1 amidohydrolase [Halalkalicoccus jeotgali B3]
MIVEGTVLRGPEYTPVEGRVVCEDGHITAIEEERVESDRIVVPAFINAHTHIGDSIAKEAGRGLTLEELVAPPDGLKHRLLRESDREEMVQAIKRSIQFMHAGGVTGFLDFREGGADGVSVLREAAEGLPVEAFAMGRDELAALEAGDGYGASGAADADFTREREAAREAGKPFGIHAGENRTDDIVPALDLDSDYLVHMVNASDEHLDRVEEQEIPVVVCPRANLVTNVGLPPMEELVERTTVALGTDNVMLNSPSMFREMEFAAKVTTLDAPEVLAMATRAGAELMGLDAGTIEEGREARLCVLDGDSDNLAGVRDPVRAVVRRAGVSDVSEVLHPAQHS